jgi:Icc-related predicted phosphoesterase
MASKRVTRILCAADPRGSVSAIEDLLSAAPEHDAHAVVVIGDLSGARDKPEGYRSTFKALGAAGLPAFWIPGAGDAPAEEYLREAHNIEIVFPQVRGVHGTLAFAPGTVLFAGLGGEISDDPDAPRDEHERLRYPRWEAEYRLKLIAEVDYHDLVLLFNTPPAHKGLGHEGSEVLAELINTYRPRLVVAGGPRGVEMLGRSLVVSPGSLADGHYAVADLHSRQAQLEELGQLAQAPRG